ncbi:hypothetical protein F8M41_015259 [Gigaspora margarita]|uniref:Uncharacterized protein n=1 Tax=Gigaspora margarita TaxID=4874 RepID=A0A8H3WUB9_GIGMA|nr:hypothetical protein F8M41_015259 [Gigaspora margarita]
MLVFIQINVQNWIGFYLNLRDYHWKLDSELERLSLEVTVKEITNIINSSHNKLHDQKISNWSDFNNSFESYLFSSNTSSTFQFIDRFINLSDEILINIFKYLRYPKNLIFDSDLA